VQTPHAQYLAELTAIHRMHMHVHVLTGYTRHCLPSMLMIGQDKMAIWHAHLRYVLSSLIFRLLNDGEWVQAKTNLPSFHMSIILYLVYVHKRTL